MSRLPKLCLQLKQTEKRLRERERERNQQSNFTEYQV